LANDTYYLAQDGPDGFEAALAKVGHAAQEAANDPGALAAELGNLGTNAPNGTGTVTARSSNLVARQRTRRGAASLARPAYEVEPVRAATPYGSCSVAEAGHDRLAAVIAALACPSDVKAADSIQAVEASAVGAVCIDA